MNPIYKFQLSSGQDTRQAFPVYRDDVAIDYELQQNEQYYRGKLSGKLTFQRDDYAFIRNKPFDTQFDLVISISYNNGKTWLVYWTGQFWKTDCQFNEDDETAIVTPQLKDRYDAVLAGLEKEFNLIDLAPTLQSIQMDKRPMIQVYVPGQTVIGCFLSGMWWEQECNAESDETRLVNTYYFAKNKTARIIDVEQTGTPAIPDVFIADPWTGQGTQTIEKNGYTFQHSYVITSTGSGEIFAIADSNNNALWSLSFHNQPAQTYPAELTLNPVAGSGATGTVKLSIHDVSVFSRYIADVENALGTTLYPIPANDIVENNRNYHYVIGYYAPETIWFSDSLSSNPTKWGLYQPGQYYQQPYSIFSPEFYPIARAGWGRISYWFEFSAVDWLVEQAYRKNYTIKNAIPIWAAISVLLQQIDPNITFRANQNYSKFLFNTNPITGIDQRLFILPKSNLISSGYDRPAEKAPITLKQILDMLRNCFRCYWFIDENNRLRIEHISYFRNGGSYDGTPTVGIDLTEQKLTRSGKPWAFGRNQYQFDKPEMAARYEFGWMDDVTELFDGYPIDIISKYVNPEKIEQISVANFTSDVDYILLNPGEISKDGFVLLAADITGGDYKLPYVNFTINGTTHILQNGWVSFMFLQQYYMYDMPAPNVEINGVPQMVYGIKKLKRQNIKFPILVEPDLTNLIKTELGNGVIQKMSVNLSSRSTETTLIYDTE